MSDGTIITNGFEISAEDAHKLIELSRNQGFHLLCGLLEKERNEQGINSQLVHSPEQIASINQMRGRFQMIEKIVTLPNEVVRILEALNRAK